MSSERRINLRFTPEHFDKIDEERFRARLSPQAPDLPETLHRNGLDLTL